MFQPGDRVQVTERFRRAFPRFKERTGTVLRVSRPRNRRSVWYVVKWDDLREHDVSELHEEYVAADYK